MTCCDKAAVVSVLEVVRRERRLDRMCEGFGGFDTRTLEEVRCTRLSGLATAALSLTYPVFNAELVLPQLVPLLQ